MNLPTIEPITGTERLVHLFELQTAMQKFNHDKRPAIVDPYSNNIFERIMAAIYYWNATTVEYAEMMNAEIQTDKTEELVDMLHFILAQLIYVGVSGKELMSLENLFMQESTRDIEWYWSVLSRHWGELMDSMPYKVWKSYPSKELRLVNTHFQTYQVNLMLAGFIAMCKTSKVSEDDLYLGYINKNVENFKRQMPGGKYEN